MKSLGSCGEGSFLIRAQPEDPGGHRVRSIVSNYHEAPSLGHSGHLVTYLARLPVADPQHGRTKSGLPSDEVRGRRSRAAPLPVATPSADRALWRTGLMGRHDGAATRWAQPRCRLTPPSAGAIIRP